MQFNSQDFAWNDEEEHFQLLMSAWDVRAAKAILRKKRHPVEQVLVSDVGHLIGDPPVPGAPPKIVMGVHVDWAKAASDAVDMNIPIIIVHHYIRKDHVGMMLIDGWHRVARAKIEKRETLRAIILNKTDSKKIMMR